MPDNHGNDAELLPSHVTSPAFHAQINKVNKVVMELIEVALRLRKQEPLIAMLLGTTDEVLDAYEKAEKEDLLDLCRLGLPLVILRVNTVEEVTLLASSGFSSAQMLRNLSKHITLEPYKPRSKT
ncbi:hypothetical protein [Polaromonas naphthalenivorans]|uniref:Uncharacterized protein n=1 Tax=Polaromonas naphthalenivorans (strain CJ2) TaxID=365044 RepID=A1VVD1_POLNA|nr:hypothetical protein [Polaromonas naphthalenivorans]ABM39609.1 hypothetical protein Pnap_4327 [Polaromonas naphthalenivorans CJ2]